VSEAMVSEAMVSKTMVSERMVSGVVPDVGVHGLSLSALADGDLTMGVCAGRFLKGRTVNDFSARFTASTLTRYVTGLIFGPFVGTGAAVRRLAGVPSTTMACGLGFLDYLGGVLASGIGFLVLGLSGVCAFLSLTKLVGPVSFL